MQANNPVNLFNRTTYPNCPSPLSFAKYRASSGCEATSELPKEIIFQIFEKNLNLEMEAYEQRGYENILSEIRLQKMSREMPKPDLTANYLAVKGMQELLMPRMTTLK